MRRSNVMTNQIPKFHETFIPILKIIETKEELHVEELKRRVRDTFYSELPQDLLNQKTSTGGLLIMNRIGWGKAYLKQAKLLEQPQRGFVKITTKGLDALKIGHLTLSELKKDADYLAARNTKDELKKEKASELEDKDFSPQDLIEDGFETIKQTIKVELLERLKKLILFTLKK